jgi:hypothetical protein
MCNYRQGVTCIGSEELSDDIYAGNSEDTVTPLERFVHVQTRLEMNERGKGLHGWRSQSIQEKKSGVSLLSFRMRVLVREIALLNVPVVV